MSESVDGWVDGWTNEREREKRREERRVGKNRKTAKEERGREGENNTNKSMNPEQTLSQAR